MLYKKITLASSQHYPMTLKTITPQHCPLATRNAAQKINIGIKSTLSNDSENKNSITTRKVTQKINIGVKSTLSTDLENNNINAPSKQEKLHKKLTLASNQQYELSNSTSTCVLSEGNRSPLLELSCNYSPSTSKQREHWVSLKKTSLYVTSVVKTSAARISLLNMLMPVMMVLINIFHIKPTGTLVASDTKWLNLYHF